jgi:hypothetical protein
MRTDYKLVQERYDANLKDLISNRNATQSKQYIDLINDLMHLHKSGEWAVSVAIDKLIAVSKDRKLVVYRSDLLLSPYQRMSLAEMDKSITQIDAREEKDWQRYRDDYIALDQRGPVPRKFNRKAESLRTSLDILLMNH